MRRRERRTGRAAAFCGRVVLAAGLSLGLGRGAQAQVAMRLAPADDAATLFVSSGAPAPDGPPGARIADYPGGDIVAAWYAEPTTRYAHGVIGDAVEGGALIVRTAAGAELRLVLPQTEVFEDLTPRLVDLDADGAVEVVTIRSSLTAGASVTIYGLVDGALRRKAATPAIGRAHRWLNIAAIAPFLEEDGLPDGAGLQIAYVETPHIGGVLRLWAYSDGVFEERASLYGFSNHAIGSTELRLAATVDLDDDGRAELLAPDAGRRTLRLMTIRGGVWREIGAYETPARIEAMISDHDGVVVRLANDRVYRVVFER